MLIFRAVPSTQHKLRGIRNQLEARPKKDPESSMAAMQFYEAAHKSTTDVQTFDVDGKAPLIRV